MCVSSRWRDLGECCERRKKKAVGPEIFHLHSGVVLMESYSPPCCRLGACVCVVWEYVSVWTEPHRGLTVEGDAELSVRGDDSDSYEQCLSAPVPPLLFSGRPICKESPRTLSTQFSPWEISDINRSTCLPYNP